MTNLLDKIETNDSDPSIVIKGMRFRLKLYDPDIVRSALEYKASENDIFIITYPKSGTTWTQTIVYGLLNNGRAFDEDIDDYISRNPFLEMHGREAVENMKRPGAIKTHLLFERVPYNSKAKYICVIRNPKDVCVSFYRFITSMDPNTLNNMTFDKLFDLFYSGQMGYVDYFYYLLSCWSHKDENNVLLILYEDMKKDIRIVIRRLAKFLDIKLNDQLLERIVKISSFDFLKNQHYNDKIAKAHNDTVKFKFLRKGIVGDWRTIFSNEQSRLLDKRFKEKTKHIQELNTLWDQYEIFQNETNGKI